MYNYKHLEQNIAIKSKLNVGISLQKNIIIVNNFKNNMNSLRYDLKHLKLLTKITV